MPACNRCDVRISRACDCGFCEVCCDEECSGEICHGASGRARRNEPMRPTNKGNLPATRRACGNCGRLGHLATTCAAPGKAHDKIGVEVEGWWLDLTAAKRAAANWHMSGSEDGSLAYDETDQTAAYEFRTRPGSLGEAIAQITAIYPDKCDKSAGMHIHMSFKDHMDIATLASPQFLRYFKDRWEAWGTKMDIHQSSDFWSRLCGDNDYCSVWHQPPRGNICGGDRYMQVNYTSYQRHKTLECRLLPLFRDARLAVLAVEEWVSIVEDFIQHVAPTVWATFDRDAAVPETFGPRELSLQLEDIRSEEMPISDIETELPLDGYTRERDIPLYIDETRDGWLATRSAEFAVTLSPTEPVAPDHVRLIGPAAFREYYTRIAREQGWR